MTKTKRIHPNVIMPILLMVLLLMGVQTAFPLDAPQLEQRVTDQTGILNAGQITELENMLLDVQNKTSSQVVLLIIPSLEGDALEDFSLRVAEKNKIGQAESSNGLLLLIAMQDKKIRFEVGYGLEGIVTDLKSGYIIRNIISSEFKKGDFYAGIYGGLKAVTGLISKEFVITPEQLEKYKNDEKGNGGHIPIGLTIFVVFVILSLLRKGGGLGTAIGAGMLMSSGSGSSGFGGGGGGGFSGGGGSFGGGGSSGGW